MVSQEGDGAGIKELAPNLLGGPGVPVCKAACGKSSPTIFFHADELKFERAGAYFWHLSLQWELLNN